MFSGIFWFYFLGQLCVFVSGSSYMFVQLYYLGFKQKSSLELLCKHYRSYLFCLLGDKKASSIVASWERVGLVGV